MNNKHLFDEKQRFSLRKLTVGLASILVGLTLFGTAQTVNSQTVHAATITQDEHGNDVIGEEPAMDPLTGKLKQEIVGVIYEAQHQDQTIHYHTSDGQSATDKDGQAVPDGHVTGKTDDKNKDVPMPNGYVPKTPGTDDKTDLNNPDPNTGKVPDKTVTVEHGQHTTAPGKTHNVGEQITPNPKDPKDAKVPGNTYQQDINDADVKKDLTRTVTINKPKADGNTTIEDGKQHIDLDSETKSSTVSYHRTTTVDDVTGKVIGHGDWTLVDPSKNQFAGVTVPQFDGYTATITDGDGHTLSSIDPENAPTANDAIEGYQSPKIVIDYTANNQSVKYIFKDGTSDVLDGTVHGVTDQTVDPATQLGDIKSALELKDYDWSKIDLGGSYKFKASGNTENVIDLSHAHGFKDVKPGDTIPDGITDPNKSGSDKHVTNSDVTETVTRHITFHDPTHENSTSTQDRHADQTVTLKRGFTYDTVTNEVTKYGDWTTQDVTAVEVPTVAGYNATVSGVTLQDGKIPGDTLRDGYTDPKIEVTYTANDSTQTIHYVDENGHELSTTDNKDQNGNVIGNSTVTVKTDNVGNVQVPKGWKLVDDHDKTTKVSYGDDGHIPTKVVKIEHATIAVTPDKPHKQGEPIDPQVPTGAKYGTGLTKDDLNEVAYREIHFKLPASTSAENYAERLKANGLSSAHVEEGTNNVIVRQEVAYKRTAVVDAITGEVKGYNPAGVKNQGWVVSGDKLVDAVIKNGSAVFNKVLIPQIAGYTAHIENAKVTDMKLVNGSHAALSRLFVSFMAIPAPKDGNSTGAVNKEHVKPDDTKPGDSKPDTTPVKDLTKSDQKKIADDTKPGKGDDTKPGKGDETKPGKGDETKPGKSDGTKQGKTDGTKPGKSDGTKPGKSDETKPGKTDGAKPGKTDGAKPGKSDETKPGKSDETKPGKSDETKPGKSDDTKPGKSDETKPGKSDETKPGKSDETKPGKGDETKPGKSDETKPGKGDKTKPGKSDDTKPGKADDTKPGKKDNTKPGKSDGTKQGKTDGAKPGKSDGTKPSKGDETKPGMSDDTKPGKSDNTKPGKSDNTKPGKTNDTKLGNAPVGNANAEANKTSHTVQAAVVKNDTKSLPQTGESQNKFGIIGAVFASLAGMIGLAGTKKKRKND